MFDLSYWLTDQVQFFSDPLGIFIFLIIYIFWVTFLLPGSWLTMVAGLLYGTFLGSIIVFIGAALGAILTFWSGRTFLRKWIQKRLDNYPKLKYVETKVSKEGLKLVILTRLSPLFPFGLLNFVFGLSQLKFQYFLVGLFAILPGTILYCSVGSLAGEFSRFSETISIQNSSISFLFSLIGFLATLLTFIIVTRAAKNALQELDSSL